MGRNKVTLGSNYSNKDHSSMGCSWGILGYNYSNNNCLLMGCNRVILLYNYSNEDCLPMGCNRVTLGAIASMKTAHHLVVIGLF